MIRLNLSLTLSALALFSVAGCATAADPAPSSTNSKAPAKAAKSTCKKDTNMKVKLTTSMGNIVVELNREKAPLSVDNFIKYVEAGHYNGTIFHRVIPNFMIQGGGMNADMSEKSTMAPIKNESTNGLQNAKYTLAMARTNVRDSATSQFFINVQDNAFLNYSGEHAQGHGYAVFGKVVEGMEVVDQIKVVPTGNKGFHQNVPNAPVVIQKAECI
jgi:peptidyl-prolyl cis-trans isomerase B (cyclophilin B)